VFPTKADADRALALAVADQTRGAWIDPSRAKTTLADYATTWLAGHPTLRPRTQRLYADLLRLHILPTLGAVELGRLSPTAVRRWHSALLSSERPGASTVAKAYRLLHAVLASAVAEEQIVRNPCTIRGASMERADERPVATVAQVYALAEAVEPRFRALVLTAAFTGLRRGELLALTRARIDLLHGTVTVVEQRHDLPDGSFLLAPPKTAAAGGSSPCPARSPSSWRSTSAATSGRNRRPSSSPDRRAVRCGCTSGSHSGTGPAAPPAWSTSTSTTSGTWPTPWPPLREPAPRS
jgi:integrase